jgi:hypothetical protein
LTKHRGFGDTYTRLAAGFEVGLATVFRYVREAVDLLADRAPSLTAALWRLAGNGHRLGVLDGTLVRIDRLGGDLDRLYYSGKHHHHGVNLQGLVDPRRGDLVWISDGLPGSTHDLTAARIHGLIRSAAQADVELFADKGYQGAGGTVTSPHKDRKLTKAQQAHNRMVNSVRGPGERGFAVLKTWRILTAAPSRKHFDRDEDQHDGEQAAQGEQVTRRGVGAEQEVQRPQQQQRQSGRYEQYVGVAWLRREDQVGRA